MSNNLGYKQAVNVERRTWDKETYEARAKNRAAKAENSESIDRELEHDENGPSLKRVKKNDEKEEFRQAEKGAAGPMLSKRAYLKSREERVDLESKIGQSEIIDPDASVGTQVVKITDGVTKNASGVGWYCKVCDCTLKDSLSYLDHINGRKHQRALGYSMRAKRSTAADVRARISELASSKSQSYQKTKAQNSDFQSIVKAKDEEELKSKAERARKREERKRKRRQEQEMPTNLNYTENDENELGDDKNKEENNDEYGNEEEE
eukprot:CAMPEP_0178955372 /NCGR_PEP_ID=MMETSP0789-20121207/9563_1 /TAXON_ID=3005 /ORGANISM="Rhizosolenia setigera, Strain CCMP 1694" /LENGTH=263 /DNA_ID=CAMNT_0020636985 /DNA_START=20 /DNA_END=811 /DNA_ORIENTATION=+